MFPDGAAQRTDFEGRPVRTGSARRVQQRPVLADVYGRAGRADSCRPGLSGFEGPRPARAGSRRPGRVHEWCSLAWDARAHSRRPAWQALRRVQEWPVLAHAWQPSSWASPASAPGAGAAGLVRLRVAARSRSRAESRGWGTEGGLSMFHVSGLPANGHLLSISIAYTLLRPNYRGQKGHGVLREFRRVNRGHPSGQNTRWHRHRHTSRQ
jgi:hypothetical protein